MVMTKVLKRSASIFGESVVRSTTNLGKKYQQLIANWEDQEKKGELDTRPPPSPEYSDDDCEIIEQEPANKANDNAPTA